MFVTKFPIVIVETMYNHTTQLTNPSQYATFHIRNHVRQHWLDRREGLWCVFTVKRRPYTKLFDLHGRVRMQVSYRRTCLYATCHIISYVCARPAYFHAVC